MAQAITNTVQSTNPFAGLLGLNPKPKATSIFSTGMQTSTPAVLPSQLQPKTTGLVSAPYTGNSQSSSTALTPGQFGGSVIPQAPAPTTKVASASAPAATVAAPVAPVQAAPAVNTPAPQTTTTTSRGLFPDVLSSLAYGAASRNKEITDQAQKIASDAGAEIARVGGEGARFMAGQKTTGTSPVAEGNAAITAQTTAAQQQAIAQGANVALQGTQQALTGQNQAQGALSTAGNLAQPFPTAFGQTSFNPATGEFANGGGGLPAEVMQQYAQMAVSGQYSAIPSFITSNPVLNAQLNVAAKALNPNFNPVQASGASGVLSNIPALTSANTAAEGIKNTIVGYLQANPQLNPSDLAAGNILQQWIQGKQLTDPKYQTLFNYLNEYTNTLAPILGVGGDPTNLKTQIAQSFINAAASGQSITQVLNAMSQLATNKIADMSAGAIGGTTSVPAPSSGASTGGFAETW